MTLTASEKHAGALAVRRTPLRGEQHPYQPQRVWTYDYRGWLVGAWDNHKRGGNAATWTARGVVPS